MEASNSKLEQLKLAVSSAESIIAQNNEVAIERHLSAIKALTIEADNLKRAVEEQQIGAKEDQEEVPVSIPRSLQQTIASRSSKTASRNSVTERS